MVEPKKWDVLDPDERQLVVNCLRIDAQKGKRYRGIKTDNGTPGVFWTTYKEYEKIKDVNQQKRVERFYNSLPAKDKWELLAGDILKEYFPQQKDMKKVTIQEIESRIEEIEEANKAMEEANKAMEEANKAKQDKEIKESRTDIVVGGFGFIFGVVGAVLQLIVSVFVYIQNDGVENFLSLLGAILILVFTILGLPRGLNPLTQYLIWKAE